MTDRNKQRDNRNAYESAAPTQDDSAKPDVQGPQTGSTGGEGGSSARPGSETGTGSDKYSGFSTNR